MKKRFLIGISIAIVLLIGLGSYLFFKPDATPGVKPDPDQLASNHKPNSSPVSGSQRATANKTKNKSQNQKKTLFSPGETRVVALGDSLTQGVGDSTNSGGYIGILDRKINKQKQKVHFDNFGHAGDRTDQLLRKIKDPKVSTAIKDADMVLITIGANDIMKIVKENVTNLEYQDFMAEKQNYNKRLQHVFKKLQQLNPKADIYLLGFYNPFLKYFHDIPELNKIVVTWNKTSERATKGNAQLHYIPTKDLFDHTKENLFYEDNFHPNDKGYQKMANRVLEYMKEK